MGKIQSVKRPLYIIIGIVIAIVFGFALNLTVTAEVKKYTPKAQIYENSNGFNLSASSIVSSVSYGKGIGSFYISADVSHESSKNGIIAYPVSGPVSFGYAYNPGDYQTDVKENWNLVDSDEKTLDGEKIPKKVADGIIIIQKSSDGKTWVDACDPINDLFSSKKLDLTSLYTVPEDDIKSGTYYRVLVMYEMKHKTGTEKTGPFGKFDKDVYEQKQFIESYVFFITYSGNPLEVIDLANRSVVTNNATVADGFTVNDNGSNTIITVKKDNGNEQAAESYDSFYTPGNYTINVSSPIGENYQNTIRVSGGLSTSAIAGNRYENTEKQGYTTESGLSGSNQLTSLMIAQRAGTTVKTSTENGFNVYGITGDRVSLMLRVMDPIDYAKTGWEVVPDEWGKKEKQTIEGVWRGIVGSGELIIQKSSDGQNWVQIEDGKYANGLFTMDYYNNYGGKGDVIVYSPDGKDVLNGIYIRVLYAYEAKAVDGKDKKRCIEEYKFRLSNDELGAVTFHNLTLGDQIKETCGDDDEITLEMYETAETMSDGAVTVTGFSIDKSLNPTVKYSVKKDGVAISNPNQTNFSETGKYEIQLTSAAGSTKTVTLFVDKMDSDETLSLYFGKGFIDGKRIFSEGQYPVFEGGKTSYVFAGIPNNYQPLYGTIKNATTGKTIDITAASTARTGKLNEAGDYIVTLYNNPTYRTDAPAGDNKTITFNFSVIQEGTAPGPKVNRKSLEDSIKGSITGTYPKYYGLMYASAAAGNITLAFSTREAAFKYAYEYEKGTVEEQEDGSYLYTGSFKVDQKTRYDSTWDLTDAINYFADQAIHELYFDASNESTYLTLDDPVLEKTDNPRTLELRRSVVIFADGQEELLTNLDALPILNSRPFAYLTPGVNGNTKSGVADFEFIKDKYGCDSNTVKIIDSNGKVIPINYDRDVDKQLADAGCATGIVRIDEKTIYNDGEPYEAVYFANGENTASIEITTYIGGQEKTTSYTQKDEGVRIEAEAFSLRSVTDKLDPYNLVVVRDENGKESSFVADQAMNGMWSDDGVYNISVVNRIGNLYSLEVVINESDYGTISFQGEGTDEFQPILVKKGDQGIKLPIPSRYGYEFAGYSDESGTMFEDVIDQVSFSGTKVLSPVWRSKKIKVTLQDAEGAIVDAIEVDYGVETEIPAIDPPEGFVFDGWLLNGEILPENKIKISEEKDVTLVAALSEGGYSPEQDIDDNKSDKQSKPILPIILILLFVGGGFIAYKNRKGLEAALQNIRMSKKHDNNNKIMKDYDKNDSSDSKISSDEQDQISGKDE